MFLYIDINFMKRGRKVKREMKITVMVVHVYVLFIIDGNQPL